MNVSLQYAKKRILWYISIYKQTYRDNKKVTEMSNTHVYGMNDLLPKTRI